MELVILVDLFPLALTPETDAMADPVVFLDFFCSCFMRGIMENKVTGPPAKVKTYKGSDRDDSEERADLLESILSDFLGIPNI
jgi:hypothetical protein